MADLSLESGMRSSSSSSSKSSGERFRLVAEVHNGSTSSSGADLTASSYTRTKSPAATANAYKLMYFGSLDDEDFDDVDDDKYGTDLAPYPGERLPYEADQDAAGPESHRAAAGVHQLIFSSPDNLFSSDSSDQDGLLTRTLDTITEEDTDDLSSDFDGGKEVELVGDRSRQEGPFQRFQRSRGRFLKAVEQDLRPEIDDVDYALLEKCADFKPQRYSRLASPTAAGVQMDQLSTAPDITSDDDGAGISETLLDAGKTSVDVTKGHAPNVRPDGGIFGLVSNRPPAIIGAYKDRKFADIRARFADKPWSKDKDIVRVDNDVAPDAEPSVIGDTSLPSHPSASLGLPATRLSAWPLKGNQSSGKRYASSYEVTNNANHRPPDPSVVPTDLHSIRLRSERQCIDRGPASEAPPKELEVCGTVTASRSQLDGSTFAGDHFGRPTTSALVVTNPETEVAPGPTDRERPLKDGEACTSTTPSWVRTSHSSLNAHTGPRSESQSVCTVRARTNESPSITVPGALASESNLTIAGVAASAAATLERTASIGGGAVVTKATGQLEDGTHANGRAPRAPIKPGESPVYAHDVNNTFKGESKELLRGETERAGQRFDHRLGGSDSSEQAAAGINVTACRDAVSRCEGGGNAHAGSQSANTTADARSSPSVAEAAAAAAAAASVTTSTSASVAGTTGVSVAGSDTSRQQEAGSRGPAGPWHGPCLSPAGLGQQPTSPTSAPGPFRDAALSSGGEKRPTGFTFVTTKCYRESFKFTVCNYRPHVATARVREPPAGDADGATGLTRSLVDITQTAGTSCTSGENSLSAKTSSLEEVTSERLTTSATDYAHSRPSWPYQWRQAAGSEQSLTDTEPGVPPPTGGAPGQRSLSKREHCQGGCRQDSKALEQRQLELESSQSTAATANATKAAAAGVAGKSRASSRNKAESYDGSAGQTVLCHAAGDESIRLTVTDESPIQSGLDYPCNVPGDGQGRIGQSERVVAQDSDVAAPSGRRRGSAGEVLVEGGPNFGNISAPIDSDCSDCIGGEASGSDLALSTPSGVGSGSGAVSSKPHSGQQGLADIYRTRERGLPAAERSPSATDYTRRAAPAATAQKQHEHSGQIPGGRGYGSEAELRRKQAAEEGVASQDSGSKRAPPRPCTATSTAMASRDSQLRHQGSTEPSRSSVSAVASAEATCADPHVAIARSTARAATIASASASQSAISTESDDISIVISASCTISAGDDGRDIVHEKSRGVLEALSGGAPVAVYTECHDASQAQSSPKGTRKLRLSIENPGQRSPPAKPNTMEVEFPADAEQRQIERLIRSSVSSALANGDISEQSSVTRETIDKLTTQVVSAYSQTQETLNDQQGALQSLSKCPSGLSGDENGVAGDEESRPARQAHGATSHVRFVDAPIYYNGDAEKAGGSRDDNIVHVYVKTSAAADGRKSARAPNAVSTNVANTDGSADRGSPGGDTDKAAPSGQDAERKEKKPKGILKKPPTPDRSLPDSVAFPSLDQDDKDLPAKPRRRADIILSEQDPDSEYDVYTGLRMSKPDTTVARVAPSTTSKAVTRPTPLLFSTRPKPEVKPKPKTPYKSVLQQSAVDSKTPEHVLKQLEEPEKVVPESRVKINCMRTQFLSRWSSPMQNYKHSQSAPDLAFKRSPSTELPAKAGDTHDSTRSNLVVVDIDIDGKANRPGFNKTKIEDLKRQLSSKRPAPPQGGSYIDKVWNAADIIKAQSQERLDKVRGAARIREESCGSESPAAHRRAKSCSGLPTQALETDIDSASADAELYSETDIDAVPLRTQSLKNLTSNKLAVLEFPDDDDAEVEQHADELSQATALSKSADELRIAQCLGKLSIKEWAQPHKLKKEVVRLENTKAPPEDLTRRFSGRNNKSRASSLGKPVVINHRVTSPHSLQSPSPTSSMTSTPLASATEFLLPSDRSRARLQQQQWRQMQMKPFDEVLKNAQRHTMPKSDAKERYLRLKELQSLAPEERPQATTSPVVQPQTEEKVTKLSRRKRRDGQNSDPIQGPDGADALRTYVPLENSTVDANIARPALNQLDYHEKPPPLDYSSEIMLRAVPAPPSPRVPSGQLQTQSLNININDSGIDLDSRGTESSGGSNPVEGLDSPIGYSTQEMQERARLISSEEKIRYEYVRQEPLERYGGRQRDGFAQQEYGQEPRVRNVPPPRPTLVNQEPTIRAEREPDRQEPVAYEHVRREPVAYQPVRQEPARAPVRYEPATQTTFVLNHAQQEPNTDTVMDSVPDSSRDLDYGDDVVFYDMSPGSRRRNRQPQSPGSPPLQQRAPSGRAKPARPQVLPQQRQRQVQSVPEAVPVQADYAARAQPVDARYAPAQAPQPEQFVPDAPYSPVQYRPKPVYTPASPTPQTARAEYVPERAPAEHRQQPVNAEPISPSQPVEKQKTRRTRKKTQPQPTSPTVATKSPPAPMATSEDMAQEKKKKPKIKRRKRKSKAEAEEPQEIFDDGTPAPSAEKPVNYVVLPSKQTSAARPLTAESNVASHPNKQPATQNSLEEVLDGLLALPKSANSTVRPTPAPVSTNPRSPTLIRSPTRVSTCSPADTSRDRITWMLKQIRTKEDILADSSYPPEPMSNQTNLEAAREYGDDAVMVKCRNSTCGKTTDLPSARRSYKTCHNCFTYYCCRGCRKEHWERHKRKCLFSRVNSTCKHVIKKAHDDAELVVEFTRVARTGFLQRGRGFVMLVFSSPERANNFLDRGIPSMDIPPTFFSIQDLSDSGLQGEHFFELNDLCRSYNPEVKYVLDVAVIAGEVIAARPLPRREGPAIQKCVKLRLSQSEVRSPPASRGHADTLILTAVPGSEFTENMEERRARDICFVNIQRKLRQRGVSLRHHHPEVYNKLCAYVADNEHFAPITLFPVDTRTGKRFMCLIMPNSEPDIDWMTKPDLLEELGLNTEV